MISFTNVSLRRGTKVLFAGATAQIPNGSSVGLVGRNGSGKSSLFDALLGNLPSDTGDIHIPRGLAIAVLHQETPSTSRTALEYVKDGDPELRTIEAAIEHAEGTRLAELHGRLDAIDGYTADARAAKLIVGLGFAADDIHRPVESFSGGWRMRLNLAQALMCRSDLLLLDEPTNHLDFEAVVWLEQWLRDYDGTLLVISHDRDFLDNVVRRILHLESQTLVDYTGNYSDFERMRSERLAYQNAIHARQQREVARMTRFVERFRAQATKARQAQSRLKALERMERVAAVHADAPFQFEFPKEERCPDPLLTLSDVAVDYPGTAPVLSNVHLTLTPGQRLGLLGFNGAGKSTLMRTIAGFHAPCAGERTEHQGIRIGYFAQHQLELLDLSASPTVHLRRKFPDRTDQQHRDFLGGFGFGGDMVDAPVQNFSGGEKSRLVLSMLVGEGPNLLLLDEPTNHLDLDMRYALEVALQDFQGALVLVSHDRHLLRTTTDDLVLVADGAARAYSGDLDDYGKGLVSPQPASVTSLTEKGTDRADGDNSEASRGDRRRLAAQQRERRRPMTARIKRIEKTIGELGAKRTALDEALSDESMYEPSNKSKLDDHLFERARIAQEIETLEAEWLELEEALEQMDDE